MSFPALASVAPVTPQPYRSGSDLAHELTSLVEDIQRTRDWFNSQIEAQLSSLSLLRATMSMPSAPPPPVAAAPVMEEPVRRASVATLFEAPHPIVDVEPVSASAVAAAFAPAAPVFTTAPALSPTSALGMMAAAPEETPPLAFAPAPAPSPAPKGMVHTAAMAAFAPVMNGFAPSHQAVVLPPTHVTALDPELEQATLRELNDALSKAFSEISSRGGMLS